MGNVNEELIINLQALQSDARVLDPNDQESIIRVGTTLEQVMSEVSDDQSGIADLFGLCLEGLRAVYEGSSSDGRKLSAAIASALAAASQMLQCDGDMDTGCIVRGAGSALWLALDRDLSECPYNNETPASEPNVPIPTTLNDLASYMIQIEPDDSAGISHIHASIAAIYGSDDNSAPTQELLGDALDAMQSIAKGASADEVLAVVGRLIERAIDAEEDPDSYEAAVADIDDEEPESPAISTTTVSVEAVPSSSGPDETYLPADADQSLLGEFITECREYIEGSEGALLTIETNSEDNEAVNTVFRAFHTIKGTSAFLGLTRISELAHKAESLLSRVRDHEIKCTGGYADLALRSTDMLKELLEGVEGALNGEPMIAPDGYDELLRVLGNPEAAGVSAESPLLVVSGGLDSTSTERNSKTGPVESSSRAITDQKKGGQGDSAVESSVRVRTDRLDRLIDMVGELVIAQSIVAQDESIVIDNSNDLSKKILHMSKIVRELQYLSMSMRMVPLKSTFQKMARLVRDVAYKSGKSVEFVTEGEETEIDRNMVDIINDPLVHMVRNAVDHGIESPDVREQVGKSRTGTVRLRAYHSGGNVVVEMSDNGKGLDREKIVAKAISKGIIESDKGMSDGEVFNLIFEPGFSTADKVTDISGRGVGLDVVRKNVETLHGKVDISSEPGAGCVFSVRLPLTLAVTDGMLVRVGEDRFIIPTINIHLSFRPEADMISTVTGRGELVMLRGELMPIFRLHRLFDVESAVDDPTDGLLVILDDGDRRCALLVDELLGQYHVVAKALSSGIGKIQGLSGGAILGDGRVGLIIDVSEIVALARQSTGCGSKLLCETAA